MNPYTFHISLYDLAFLGAIFIGLNLALLLWFTKMVNQGANRFLALALSVTVLWMISILSIDVGLATYYPHWCWIPLKFSLALGPLIFFYVLKITRPEYKPRFRDLLHFSPLLLELGAHVLEVRESFRSGATAYNTMIFQQLNPVIQLLAFISVITYLYRSHKLIEGFYQRIKFNGGDRYRVELRWLRNLLTGFGLLWLLWIPNAAVDYFYYHHQPGMQAYYPLYLFLVVIFIRIATVAFLRPANKIPANGPHVSTPQPGAELRQKGIWLKQAMITERYYQDPELSLSSLAEKLELHTHELSRIINIALKKNFNDFINEYRVREVAQRMQDPAYDQITLLGIAYDSGFNSKATFNRTFRQMTGKSPAEYKNELKKERSSYNLRPYYQSATIISYQGTTPKWSNEKLNRNIMIRNYLKIAFRSFWKHKLFTLINVIGLSIGISAALVIYLIVHYDFTFDKFHKDSDRIYRVVSNGSSQGQHFYTRGVSGPLAPAIRSQASGIELTASVFTLNPDVLIPGKKGVPTKFKNQDRISFTSPEYFKIFNYIWLAGSPSIALNEPKQVVLTAKQARIYFPLLSYEQMIGKVITYDTLKTTVTGIVQNFTENTDLTLHDFISYSTVTTNKSLSDMVGLTQWGNTNSASVVFIKLRPKILAVTVEKQLNTILNKASPPTPEDKGSTRAFALQKLEDIHFNTDYGTFDFSDGANKTTLYGLLVIASFLLVLGCINFINLTTAQATQRAKEIGIRKTMGSSRAQLVIQFLSETFFLTLFAVVISAALAPLILKLFADFVNPGVKANFIDQPDILLFLLILTLVVSALSGFYPAMMLSGYKPVQVLKNQVQNNSSKTRNAWLRKSLTVSQFVIAQFFIMATLLVSKQIYYALHKDLGFKKDAIIVVNTPYKTRTVAHNQVLLNKLRAIPQIEMVGIGTAPPSSGSTSSTIATYMDGKKEIKTAVELKFGDENYIKIYHIKLLAGRNIEDGDTAKAGMINNAYAKVLGFRNPADALGKQLLNFNGPNKNMTIVGVLGDFSERSLHSAINPLTLLVGKAAYQTGTLHVSLKPETAGGNEWKTAITSMGKAWKEVYPDDDFDYQFYDKSIAQFYDTEQHTATLLIWATGLSILISCLGLLGLAIYTTGQRTKEIGVRKVLGATVVQIVTLLSTELVILVLLAFVIVTPVSYMVMKKFFFQNFADTTSISWWVFAISGAGMLVVSLVTLSFQTIKAAITNPVKSLRSE